MQFLCFGQANALACTQSLNARAYSFFGVFRTRKPCESPTQRAVKFLAFVAGRVRVEHCLRNRALAAVAVWK